MKIGRDIESIVDAIEDVRNEGKNVPWTLHQDWVCCGNSRLLRDQICKGPTLLLSTFEAVQLTDLASARIKFAMIERFWKSLIAKTRLNLSLSKVTIGRVLLFAMSTAYWHEEEKSLRDIFAFVYFRYKMRKFLLTLGEREIYPEHRIMIQCLGNEGRSPISRGGFSSAILVLLFF